MSRTDFKRHKEAYERHEAGETYREIAESMGVCKARAAQLANRWARRLKQAVWLAENRSEEGDL